MEELRARDMGDVMIFGGGVIPDADAAALKQQGVSEIFGPGSSLKTIAEWLEAALDQREKVSN
jgi:methylmalonyl-CoA mutase C-terminal domain/subunit